MRYHDEWTRQAILKRLQTTLRVWLCALAAGNDDAFAMVETINAKIRRVSQ